MKFTIEGINPAMVNPLGMLIRKSAYAFSERFALIGVGVVDVSVNTGYTSTDIAMRLQGLNPWINEEFIESASKGSVQDGQGTLKYSTENDWYEYSMVKSNTNSITLGDFGKVFAVQGQDPASPVVEFANSTGVEMTLFIKKVSTHRSMEFNENVLSALGGKGIYNSSGDSLEIISLPSENCKQTIKLTPIEEESGKLIVEMDMPSSNSRVLVAELLKFFSKVTEGIEKTQF